MVSPGEVAEWLKAHDSKSCMRQRIAGSNPALSASEHPTEGVFIIQDQNLRHRLQIIAKNAIIDS